MKEKLDKIEFILEHLREPERLLQEEFVSWLQEEENKHLFEEVTTNRMAFLQKEYGQQIEPELEWQKLWQQMQKDFYTPIPEKRKINRRVWYSMAAGVCVLMALAGGLLLQQGKEKKSVSPMAQIEHVGKRSPRRDLPKSRGRDVDHKRHIKTTLLSKQCRGNIHDRNQCPGKGKQRNRVSYITCSRWG